MGVYGIVRKPCVGVRRPASCIAENGYSAHVSTPGPRGTSREPGNHMGGKTMPGRGGASAHGGDATTHEATEATETTGAAHAATSEE